MTHMSFTRDGVMIDANIVGRQSKSLKSNESVHGKKELNATC